MKILSVIFIITGIVFVFLFLMWFCFVTRDLSKSKVLIGDIILIVLCVVVLLMGLQLRRQKIVQDRLQIEQELQLEVNEESALQRSVQANLKI